MRQQGPAAPQENVMNGTDQLRLKLITDETFRKLLLEDTATALKSVGIEPTGELLNTFEDLKKELAELARILDADILSV
jgi:hypothetical protein